MQGLKRHQAAIGLTRPRKGGRGFTLIEMLAVIAIMALVFAVGLPRLGTSKLRLLRGEAESVAASLEFARQSAIMTAIPHRLLIDLEDGEYRVEWLVTQDQAFASGPGDDGFQTSDFSLEGASVNSIELRPPPRSDRDYYPVSNRRLGAFSRIDDALYFVGLDSPSGWIEGGDVAIVFQADGTTEFAMLEIADVDDNHITLEIEPLLDRIRRRMGPARS